MKEKGVNCIVAISAQGELSERLEKIRIKYVCTGHMAAMEVPPEESWKKVPVFIVRKVQYTIALYKAVQILEKSIDLHKIDIIHTNSARNDLGAILAEKYQIRHIVHLREFGEEDFGCWTYRGNYVKYLTDRTEKFIAISCAVKACWVAKGIDANKITVIYNGVDCDVITPKQENSDGKDLRLVIVGGVCEAKGQLQAVQALGLLPEEMKPYICLDIVGWGNSSYMDEIRRTAERHNILNKVSFLGVRNDVCDLLKNYDVGLMCSKSEGFGRVTIEYMHAGLGVIASRAGANEEIISEGKTGLLYDLNDTQSLENCIEKFYFDRQLLKMCATEGKSKAITYFTKKINADNIFKQYNQLLDN